MSINAIIESTTIAALDESAKATALISTIIANIAALKEVNETQACGPCAHISLANEGRAAVGLPLLSYDEQVIALKAMRKAGIARLTGGLVVRTATDVEKAALETAVYYGQTAALYVGKSMDSRDDYAVGATDEEGRRWFGKVTGRSIYQSIHRPEVTWVGWI